MHARELSKAPRHFKPYENEVDTFPFLIWKVWGSNMCFDGIWKLHALLQPSMALTLQTVYMYMYVQHVYTMS